MEGVIGCHSTEDKKVFLENISRMPETIHVTKFNDLWKPHVDHDGESNVANAINVKKLCAKLNGATIEDHSSSTTRVDSDSDGWESFDENESNGDPSDGETTEVEKGIDLNDALEKLKLEFGF